ncbi:MAG: sugar phosphate isomerase/epimerase [Acidobacteria bacterium]|nr:sugar phosphate isomerase/epimerase [Acidobacteriota bacterium]
MSNLDRRRLLTTALATAAAGTTSALLAATPADTGAGAAADDIRLGVASYSLRAYSRRIAIAMTRRIGAQYINIKDFHLPMNLTAAELQKARAEFDKAGLTVTGGGTVSFQVDDEADIKAKFDYAKAAGLPLMVAAPTAVTLPKLEKYVKQYDIKIAVHNHGPEDKHFPNPQSILGMVKNMDPRVGICCDVGHAVRTGVDITETIRECGSRLLDMHIKDLTDFTKASSQVPVGEGKMPIVAIFKELKKMRYPGAVMLEYEVDEDNPVPGMQRSFSYMRGALAGLRG